ncbi:MAG: hypothetical protein ACKPAD_10665, partial [Bacteroidota bacterium]
VCLIGFWRFALWGFLALCGHRERKECYQYEDQAFSTTHHVAVCCLVLISCFLQESKEKKKKGIYQNQQVIC